MKAILGDSMRISRRRRRGFCRAVAVWRATWPAWYAALLLAVLLPRTARAADPDLQLWAPVQFIHPIGESWTASMQTELRLQDDISEFSQLVLKPAINYHFDDDRYAFSFGYKNIQKYEEANENDVWQEFHINRKHGDLVGGLQFRLEERFIEDIDGVLPRLRVLQHLSHPIGDGPKYLTGFCAVRFNLDDKGKGPVEGFEQSRIYTAVGHHVGDHTLFEVGYLWRYEFMRDEMDLNDHALHLQLVYHARANKTKKPTMRHRYR